MLQKSQNLRMDALYKLFDHIPERYSHWIGSQKMPGISNKEIEDAKVILTVLPRLMNQMIVQVLLDDAPSTILNNFNIRFLPRLLSS